ncbi:MHYT domain-containing protein [Streptomyces sp. NPDC004539]|uniref:MHYT domain-containing protein n=1 Tax=Streptomyces sp. NPDC004539 TaxID=3154280 RepID=UPI0033BB1FA8
MTATLSEFHYGLVTPVAAYVMACVGSILALRCTTRSLRRAGGERRWGWLALGAISLGCGIWTMHFIAMIGFTVDGELMRYDAGLTMLSLLVAIVVVSVGVFLVGYRGAGAVNLGIAGTVTGLGVAAMHYMGMGALQVNGGLQYDTGVVVLSVVIAVVAATAALWAAVSISAVWATLGASLVMGAAVSVMHYTGMSAVSVHAAHGTVGGQSSADLLSFMLAMLAGPLILLLIAGVIVMFDPEVVMGRTEWEKAQAPAEEPAQGVGAFDWR